MEELKNKKNIIILLILFLLVLFTFLLILKMGEKNRIEKNLLNNGFIKDEYKDDYIESNLYIKDLSDININQFYKNVENNNQSNYYSIQMDLDTYLVSGRYISYLDGVTSYFISEYDYKDNKYHYSYETIYDDKNISFDGSKEAEDFNCKSSETINDDNKEIICNYIEEKLNQFEGDINNEIIDKNMLPNKENKIIHNSPFKKVSFIILLVLSGIVYLLYRKTNSDSI